MQKEISNTDAIRSKKLARTHFFKESLKGEKLLPICV